MQRQLPVKNHRMMAEGGNRLLGGPAVAITVSSSSGSPISPAIRLTIPSSIPAVP